jgi:hypothetical protein
MKNDKSFEIFLEELNASNTALLSTCSTEFGTSNQGSIYFPYSEEFVVSDCGYYSPITNVLTATADADEGWIVAIFQ